MGRPRYGRGVRSSGAGQLTYRISVARFEADRAPMIEDGGIRDIGTMEDFSRVRAIQKEYLSQ